MYDSNNFGLNDDYEYHEIIIDSRDAVNSFESGYTSLNWPKIQLGKPLERVAAIKVLQVIIPKTYYPINSTNNVFGYYSWFSTDPVRWTNRGPITIPVGQYTQSEIIPVIQSLLGSTPTSWTITDLPSQIKTLYTNNGTTAANRSYMFSFTNTSQTSTEVNNSARTNPRLVLGWQGGAGQATGAALAAGTSGINVSKGPNVFGNLNQVKAASTPNVVQNEGDPYIYLNSSILGSMVNLYLNGNGHMNAPNTGADGPELCSIPVPTSVPRTENIIYTDPDKEKWFKFGGNLDFPQVFDMYLTLGVASDQVPLDLNGESFIVKLGVLTNKKEFERTFPSSTVGGYERVRNLIVTK
jgi:hypothetical protein